MPERYFQVLNRRHDPCLLMHDHEWLTKDCRVVAFPECLLPSVLSGLPEPHWLKYATEEARPFDHAQDCPQMAMVGGPRKLAISNDPLRPGAAHHPLHHLY